MQTFVFDTNIYYELACRQDLRNCLRSLIDAGAAEVLCISTIERELALGPLGGLPDWFPIRHISETAMIMGHSEMGDAEFGGGDILGEFEGESQNRLADALIADAAHSEGAVVVSQNKKDFKRLDGIARRRCAWWQFDELAAWLSTQQRTNPTERTGPTG